ncbi:hypothetical protein SLEP1_g52780 [Rubroshorea leprosula]|uniref:Uncharacterized protein n=1 Tax=Rubroshorea leprosula TaxID=152421 RepID=A0AAV5M7C2_9ROSI|nr:hypothetical protein SLEP1_g52780 [Rubroshorea leprosula]
MTKMAVTVVQHAVAYWPPNEKSARKPKIWVLYPDYKHSLLVKVASIREVVLGAPLRCYPAICMGNHFLLTGGKCHRGVSNEIQGLHRYCLCYFLPEGLTGGLNNAPRLWSPSTPMELNGAPEDALSANAEFVSFGKKLDHTVSNSSTFNAYVNDNIMLSMLYGGSSNLSLFPAYIISVLRGIYAYPDAATCGVFNSSSESCQTGFRGI